MENEKDFYRIVGVCKKAIADKSVSVKVEKRENEYYDTEIISAKNKGLFGDKEEIFSLCIKSDPTGADYKLSFDNKDYVPNGWLQTRKTKRLRKISERYAIKQYKAYVRG